MDRVILDKIQLFRLLRWFLVISNNHSQITGSSHSNLKQKIKNILSVLNASGYSDKNVIVRSYKYRDVYKFGVLEFYFNTLENKSVNLTLEFEEGEENLRWELLRLLDKNAHQGNIKYQDPAFEVIPQVVRTEKGLRVIT